MTGRGRPVERDALRILTILHELGERAEGARGLDFESQLQALLRLTRDEVDLALVVLDSSHAGSRSAGSRQPAERRELAGRVRELLAAPRGPSRPATGKLLAPTAWRRLDDALALLACRELLRVEPRADGELRFRLTARAESWLEGSVSPAGETSARLRERCALLRDVLPADLLHPRDEPALEAYLGQAGERLDELRREEQIPPEDDMLGGLFQTVFLETL